MYLILAILTSVVSLNAFAAQACCNKSSFQNRQEQISSTATTKYELSSPTGYAIEKFPQEIEQKSTSNGTIFSETGLKQPEASKSVTTIIQHDGEQLSSDDLNSLRLEYNKYKILSTLGLRVNPDQLEPSLDSDARFKLTASTIRNEEIAENGSRKQRQRRSLGCNQISTGNDACCVESFYVNFTEIGWDKWILYPAGYHANYCRGQCDLSNTRYYHSSLLSKFSNVIGLCCSPKQMAPLRLLFIDENNKVHQKTMPDMIVEQCDCA